MSGFFFAKKDRSAAALEVSPLALRQTLLASLLDENSQLPVAFLAALLAFPLRKAHVPANDVAVGFALALLPPPPVHLANGELVLHRFSFPRFFRIL